jgi:hypothetical protein
VTWSENFSLVKISSVADKLHVATRNGLMKDKKKKKYSVSGGRAK